MSINFNAYGIKSNDMSIDDLEVGQTLIRILRPKHYDSMTPIKTVEYTIVKVLKTRLVVESTDNPSRQLRLIVDQKKWSFRNNMVTTDIEGNTSSWNREPFEFATEDEQPLIDEIIAHRNERIAEAVEKNELIEAIAQVRHELHGNPDLAKVDAAIAALTKLRAKFAAE